MQCRRLKRDARVGCPNEFEKSFHRLQMSHTDLVKPSLLAVFAHPDDEAFSSGGTLAHYAKLGVDVTLISSTRGEAGKVTDPVLGEVKDVGALRETELQNACKELGINPPIFLGYHDSGRLERLRKDDPLASINADPLEMEQKIRNVIKAVKPQVILTFDPHGGYGHPDHLVIHSATLAAFFSSGDFEDAPQRLFYTAMPTEIARMMFASNASPTPGLDPELYGVSRSTIAFGHDIAPYLDQKTAALKAHASQVGPTSRMGQMPEAQRLEMQKRMSFENFSLGGIRGVISSFPLRGFFDGLGLDVI
jgi:N-acetyl-1-D-myo-inositol-2-amino-2-deoxy-alpha-D-glucopyranoside deacetylase